MKDFLSMPSKENTHFKKNWNFDEIKILNSLGNKRWNKKGNSNLKQIFLTYKREKLFYP